MGCGSWLRVRLFLRRARRRGIGDLALIFLDLTSQRRYKYNTPFGRGIAAVSTGTGGNLLDMDEEPLVSCRRLFAFGGKTVSLAVGHSVGALGHIGFEDFARLAQHDDFSGLDPEGFAAEVLEGVRDVGNADEHGAGVLEFQDAV